jgi:hypothetical protein
MAHLQLFNIGETWSMHPSNPDRQLIHHAYLSHRVNQLKWGETTIIKRNI